ncbi:MAG: preprotein translocase subunit YajC [Actinobacteria bacterium]|nr:preprotein translocase subunit YajC [Actinomycetota bacterium]
MNNIGLLAIYVVGFIAIFYFLAVRPQQKQRKAHEQLINSVKRGDRIVTIGGVFGTVKRVEEGLVVVEIDKGVNIKVARRAIAEIASAEQKATAAKVLDKPVKDEDVEEIEPVEAEAVEEVDADATEPPADVEEEKK